MYLSSFSAHTNHLHIENLQLSPQNLIVGKNASGKSNTLKELWYFLDELFRKNSPKKDGRWEASFYINENETLSYDIKVVGNTQFIDRYRNGEKIPENIKIPSDLNEALSMFTIWTKLVLFGNTEPSTYSIRGLGTTWAISDMASRLERVRLQLVVQQMNTIGYTLEKIYFEETTHKVFITEKGGNELLAIEKMSQGMYRAFSLLLFLTYLIEKKEISLLIIDDFCEGLDYERATKLGKLVFNLCKENDIQLIATTNDSFLMEAIDISCWNVLQRKGENITTLNERSHPALFEKFPISGLNNFDFFASDYIARHLEKEKT